jgi:stearoyl-CoA desaturase (delta-9 desaturase)
MPTDHQIRPRVRRRCVPLTVAERWYPPCVILLPLAGVIMAAVGITRGRLSLVAVTSFLGAYALIGLGVALGYHRLIAHNAFQTHPSVRYILAVLGTMSGQGTFFNWIADHRLHHVVTDVPGDPHSPHWRDDERLGGLRGLLHAHVGWLFLPRHEGRDALIPDLVGDPIMRWIDRRSVPIVFAGLAIPGMIAFALTGNTAAVVDAMLWAGPVRMFALNHTTWCVNSLGHAHGPRHFASGDESRDHPLLAMLAFGDGWHNGHHAFPKSARHGLVRGQIDPAFEVIRLLERLGIAWDVHLPYHDRVERKLIAQRDGAPARGLPVRPAQS